MKKVLLVSIVSTLILLTSFKSVVNENKSVNLQLIGIECISQEDFTGTDQIYIKINGEKVTNTGRISSGDYMDLTNLAPYSFSSRATIQVWEYDMDPDDLVLEVTVYSSYAGAGQKYHHDTRDANYKLYYKVY